MTVASLMMIPILRSWYTLIEAASTALVSWMIPISTWIGSFISQISHPNILHGGPFYQSPPNSIKSLMIMVTLISLRFNLPICSGLTCPSSCANISPLPYPFGAIPGCGSPGFLMTNCSVSPPQWNLTLGTDIHTYYIKSINPSPNVSNIETGSNTSYGYGGSVLLYLTPSTNVTPFCQINASLPAINDFTNENLYAFPYAELSFYQERYLFFNCSTASNVSAPPDSGVLNFSSPSCNKYINYCSSSTTRSCIEYSPDKELQLAALMRTYNCSSLKMWVIPNEDSPISSWISATQLVWGPVQDADRCSTCQKSGGACGYDTEDNNTFHCYCGDKTYMTDCNKKSSGRVRSVVIGVSAAAIVIMLLTVVACYHRYRLYHFILAFTNRKRLNLDGINQAPLDLPYWSLSAATKSFSTKIGQGGFGTVYRGVLYNGSEVAVKVLDSSITHMDEQCLNEVATIGNIHHVNIARLVGYCFRKSRRILVYEYVSNGSLDKYLFSKKQAPDVHVLNWKQRFHIALGVARGLAYMHEECRNCIIHCDIKPQNILLDMAFFPKIADFGLARLLDREESRVLTHARGTPGYVAPELWSLGRGPLSAKFDVYSYGMVLLEIIRGRRSFEEFDPIGGDVSEAEMESFLSMSMDERIQDEADVDQVEICTRVALWCIQEDPSRRPAMSNVVQYLQGTAAVPDNPPRPFRAVLGHEENISKSRQNSSESFLKSFDRSCHLQWSRD